MISRYFLLLTLLLALQVTSQGQESAARKWNDVLLEAIRNDLARPTVHARNLFHISAAMYDAWAAYDDTAEPYFLGNSVGTFQVPFEGVSAPTDIEAAREEALSYAVYRLMRFRFVDSPGADESLPLMDSLFNAMGYDPAVVDADYTNGSPASLGNYIAQQVINFGSQDGSNEENNYDNLFYEPVNEALDPTMSGNSTLTDPNRWQPLMIADFVDQSGNPVSNNTPEFLSPEWGSVVPFSLDQTQMAIFNRDGDDYTVYMNPGAPPFLGTESDENYKWGFSMVSVWSAHLDPDDGVMWDISPGAIGNTDNFPTTFDDHDQFYLYEQGGDIGEGHPVNPATGLAYTPQMVPRGDYTRVLAEFWADGPDSETPPGHWYTILNTVSDSPELEKRFKGEGEILDDLEWDVKSYFALGGAMHDAAVTAWGIKGWHDYIRPISAIRYMADQGQSSDESLASYSEEGIPLVANYIELVETGDPLAGSGDENVGKIKLYAWVGPDSIADPEVDKAGVDWILAENWWPYQRPSFVTPPFAGYISGHSTFSRAAAEVLTLLTGDPFFPGGVGEFAVQQNEFLVFEEGPSVDFTLQWATYRDASDQTSLSRIWGGIHPPADDIPGRILGEQIGIQAFGLAEEFFSGNVVTGLAQKTKSSFIYPNPITAGYAVKFTTDFDSDAEISIYDLQGRKISEEKYIGQDKIQAPADPGVYVIRVVSSKSRFSQLLIVE